MRGLPQDLIFALLFGAFLLVQFLYRALRRKTASMQAQREAEVAPAASASTPAPANAAPRPDAARITAPPPRPPLPPAPARLASRTPLRARRFSRAALMPDRRAVQDAVVIAAILHPCHAQRARDNER